MFGDSCVQFIRILNIYKTPSYPGYYAYIEGSYPRVENHTAVLQSPWIKTEGVSCSYDFWYFMHGSDVGSLTIDMEVPI